MNLNQPEPLIKLPIYIEQDSMQYQTSVITYSAKTLNFVSDNFFTQNNLLGKKIRGPKIVAQITNEQRISTSKIFSPTYSLLG